MRILIHGLNYAPELVGVGKYTGEMAEWLAARGHQVRVVSAPPFNPEAKVFPGFSAWQYCRETSDAPMEGSLTIFRCPLWIPRQPGTLARLFHLASFAISSLPAMLRQAWWHPEVVIVLEPTLFCLPAARLCSRWAGATSWLHIQDFEVDAAFDLGMVGWAGVRRLVEWLEQRLMSRFDRVSTISGKMLERLARKGVPAARRVLFENWVDTSQIYPLKDCSPIRAELGIPSHAVVALYSGSMGSKQGLEILVEAARELAGKAGLHFVFCGEGPARAKLAELAAGVSNLHLMPLQPLARLNDLLNIADIHLLPQRADAADLVMPSKLTGMLASGRPVIATARPGTQLASALQGRGIVTAPEDGAALVAAIQELAQDASLRSRLGHNARTYAISELEKNTVLARFERELIDSSSPSSFRAADSILSDSVQ